MPHRLTPKNARSNPYFLTPILIFLLASCTTNALAQGAGLDCGTVSQISLVECQALVALYTDTNGISWTTNTDWLATTTPCSWFGITCTAGRVTELKLGGNALTGTIPPEIGNLTNLTRLILSSNALTGTIPPEIGNLTNLRELQLQENLLSGTVQLSVAQVMAGTVVCESLPGNTDLCFPDTPDYQALGGIICQRLLDASCQVVLNGLNEAPPATFEFFPNYPNPFSKSTVLGYYLPEGKKVSMVVLDAAGRKVDVLLNEYQAQGRHEVVFHGSGLPPGLYLVRLRVGLLEHSWPILKIL